MTKLFRRFFRKHKEQQQTTSFPGFDIPVQELSAFAQMEGLFIISLKNGRIVQHRCEDREAFYQWLTDHNIRDITKEAIN